MENHDSTASSQDNQGMGKAAFSRRKAVKSIGVVAAAGALAAAAVLPTLALADNSTSEKEYTFEVKPSNINVLLVHGAFADASCWGKVVPVLQKLGHKVLAVQLPLTGLSDDVAVAKKALASLAGPTVVVGHSYGGAVISGAANGATNAIGLVYVAAYAPDSGESIGSLNNLYPPSQLPEHITLAYRDGFGYIDPAFYPQVFAADVEPTQAKAFAVSQNPTSFNAFGEPAGPAAWRNLPSWYMVSKKDLTINPDLERFLAKRMKASTIEVNSSHLSPVSHPLEIVGLVKAAVLQYHKQH